MILLLLISSLVVSSISLPFVRGMLLEGKIKKENFKGDLIPVGMGMTLIPVLIIHFVVLTYFYPHQMGVLLIYFGGIMTMAFVGMVDDLMGNRDTLGFKGHIGSLLKGKLTTGGFKAVMGGMIALLISFLISSNVLQLIANFLVIGLMTNLLNLMDLRPGRAIKSFGVIALVFLFVGLTRESIEILAIVAGYSIAYFPQDLKSRAMMGDVGSNTLGITLGIAVALSFTTTYKVIILIGLIAVHIVAEKYSITKIIGGNRVLSYLDELGRN
ncbi:MraY family glycosyltransferase [Alkaliphilus hydrothermalis]|uniref:UDP-N-acetylmuramyl pentapeptide phosphotransferase/UDP-N-acetylglucosamine-1-phosphate transferase n=1 Tax=Alkaliphilus hydrothermalis TaxID=1482730 RepID=A0ABS2NM89_9FIRM|nr:glycosyltransferase [Alkaliphilus hydrothermalis]MBM7614022.1 UDP-N-acetylmuramyl pentapeptide phosphotransferase/UDP-N-acetylglucosamine-1-phosphate transferase [Alkaliphilus hydrothermalis]